MNKKFNWKGLIILLIATLILISTIIYTSTKIIISGVKYMFSLICFVLGGCVGLGKHYVAAIAMWAFNRAKYDVKGEIGMDSPPPSDQPIEMPKPEDPFPSYQQQNQYQNQGGWFKRQYHKFKKRIYKGYK